MHKRSFEQRRRNSVMAEKDAVYQDEDGVYIWEKHYPKGASWRDVIESKPLYTIMDRAVEKYGDFKAVHFLGKEMTYKEIGGLVNRVAKGLQNMGVVKGTKIGLFLPNTPYSMIFYYAILKAGGIVVNYNPLYAEHELVNQIEDSETDIMVTLNVKVLYEKAQLMLNDTRVNKIIVCPLQEMLPFPKSALFPFVKCKEISKIPHDSRHVWFKELLKNEGDFKAVEIDSKEDIAVLQYTGGTTGIPKGAMLTHANLYANVQQTALWLQDIKAGEDSQVAVLPFFHVFAMTVIMNMSVWFGMRILMQPSFDVEAVLKLIDQEKPTYFPAVPAILNAIASSSKVEDYDLSSLKFCLSGGAPLPGDVKRLFEEKTGCHAVGEGYGLTETSPVAACNPIDPERVKVGSIGMPFPGTIIEIVDRDDGKTILPLGEKGEICIRGPQVMKGYYKQQEATDDVIIDGRLHTGDVGYIDDEGYIYIVDRIKDLILVRGYNVYPRHVEEAIYEHPSVEECIVAGVPDKSRGETVWAWIKPYEGRELLAEDLNVFLENKLSPIERPRKYMIRNEPLPKTAVGKLSRKDLLEQEGIERICSVCDEEAEPLQTAET